jgi:prephenate dehydrogenase
MERKRIAIVGVGLIGGSLAIQLHEKKISSRLTGVESNKENAKAALELELVDEILPLYEAIASADVIILAIPVDKLVELLPTIMDKIDQQVVVDMGSTKSQLVNVIRNHPKRGRYVAKDTWQRTRCGEQNTVVRKPR